MSCINSLIPFSLEFKERTFEHNILKSFCLSSFILVGCMYIESEEGKDEEERGERGRCGALPQQYRSHRSGQFVYGLYDVILVNMQLYIYIYIYIYIYNSYISNL